MVLIFQMRCWVMLRDGVRRSPCFGICKIGIVAMRQGQFVIVADPDYELSISNMFDEWIQKSKRVDTKIFEFMICMPIRSRRRILQRVR